MKLLFAILVFVSGAAKDDDDDDATPNGASPSLTAQQEHAVGIVVARAPQAKAAQRTAAFGQVLDPAQLVADAGEVDATAAAARAAGAEVERAQGLYNAGAGTSLKTLQAAQSEQARTRALADAASARFNQRWSALDAQSVSARQSLLAAVSKGKTLLVRAELPGRVLLGALPARGLIDADGIGVPAQVLGAMAAANGESSGTGVLLAVTNAPVGIAAGARVPVSLIGPAQGGFLVPRSALLYDESGAYVFKRLTKKTDDGKTAYTSVKIKLLEAQGDAWLIDGIDDDDDIVMHGAGVLWSLQGISGRNADDDDD